MIKKTEYIKAIAERTGLTQRDVKTMLDSAQDIALETILNGDEINIFYWLKLGHKIRSERMGRNPATGETLMIPERKVPHAHFTKLVYNALKAE